MSKLAFGLALVGAFLAGGLLMNGMVLQAQDKAEPKPRGQLYPKWRDLGLNKDQIEKIYKIQTDQRVKISKLEADIRKLKAEERAEAEKILTPAQKARLKELLSGDGDKDKVKPTDKPADKAKPGDKDLPKDKKPN